MAKQTEPDITMSCDCCDICTKEVALSQQLGRDICMYGGPFPGYIYVEDGTWELTKTPTWRK